MKKGFTLVEMLVAITITAIILTITISQFLMQKKHVDMQQTQIKLGRDTRLSLIFLGKELREIGLDPKKTNAFGITKGDNDTLTYITDKDMDGFVDIPTEVGNIYLIGNTLVFNGTHILSGVTAGGLNFTYFDKNGFEILALPINEQIAPGFFSDTVALIKISLTTEKKDIRGKLLARSEQTASFERKNR
jgi:prepilin-type N-terminal cleavage/methylation domain-containing protein